MASNTISELAHLQIPLKDILKATNNFHDDNIISQGTFGPAYKGRLLRSGTMMKIVARRLDHKRGRDSEFWTEVSVLSELKHRNIVSIIGFCDEKGEKVIITTREANGSLEQFLDDPDLTWTQRLRISVGVALGLSYLHYDKGRDYAVIHRNINSGTILLDENWEAKLSGFEFSVKQSVNRIGGVLLCEPIGTMGYIDPTVEKSGGVTHKSDIFSFGVVLFEILCGRKAFIHNDANEFLAELAISHYENNTIENIIYPDLWIQMSLQSLLGYSEAAYSCLNNERAHRPDTSIIVDALQKALEIQQKRENVVKNLEHLMIPLDDIKLVTDDFSETFLIGDIGYHNMYIADFDLLFNKEDLSSIEGKNEIELIKRHNTVIIKQVILGDDLSVEEKFYTSISTLASVKHPNIVGLLGFCVEEFQMILVTESLISENFVHNGYLSSYLGDNNMGRILTWEERLRICIDVAHALNYIHQEKIINCYISSFNIELDENLKAKIFEFGHSEFLPPNQKDEALYHNMPISSTCYTDPEYSNTGKLTKSSDVYSFGVVLFEVLCGRLAADPIYKKKNDRGLAPVARRNVYMGTIEGMIDPLIKEENRGPNENSLKTFIEIACMCVSEKQDERPKMEMVVKQLEEALTFQEDGVQPLHIDQLANELEKTLELQLTHENIPVESSNTDQDVDKLDKALEVELKYEILEKKLEHLRIPLSDIELATNNFSETYKITSWGHIKLYRSELYHFEKEKSLSIEGKNEDEHPNRHKTVVIKRYPPRGHYLYGEEKFFTEIEMLTSVKHPNIVTLLGFCIEGSEMILVIENIANGYLGHSLENINDKHVLTWEKRLKICIDVAHALNYLHSEMNDQKIIINRNIKSDSIGLDENHRAKISDFEFSILLPPNQEDEALYPNMRVGMKSYIDPEYLEYGKLKRESDVYSFGVVLFEVLCGRLANDPIYKKKNDTGLAHVARQSFHIGTLEDMIDPIIMEETNYVLTRGPNKDSLHTFIEIACQCIAETQDQRPTMKVVVKELEKALLFQNKNKDNLRLSIEVINLATRNFHKDNCIGGGGFGRVFRGTLQDGDNFKTIVAKRLDTRLGQGEQQFLSELQILSEYKHENVVNLVAYCDQKDEKIIIYEYASRGSLDRYLNDVSLTWVKRLNICIDVASALNFLHGGVGKQAKVIHRDIKTANILLDNDWKAKLADFGLSLISPINQETDYVIDHVCGTLGYVDPLYKESGFLTIESDIYSFGVVLFEILCGRSTFAIQKQEGHYLPKFVENKFEEGKHDEIVFEQIREEIVPKSLTTFQEIAYQCLHQKREKRPTTKRVLAQLKKALEFQNMASTINKLDHLKLPLEDIVKATNNFHDDNIIGHGEFGTSYKGRLVLSGKLMTIAAQRFDCKYGEGDFEFWTRILVLVDLKHTNIVSIVGFCDENDEKIIVTTYGENGSLSQYLNSPSLTWTQKLNICVGVARALTYLHYYERRDYVIIHCNINSDTILVDKNWEAKLSGFEMSIKQSVYCKDEVCLCKVTGTKGYMDPKIAKTGGVTYMSDIYSLGVVLFEILFGRKAYVENEANEFLVPLAIRHCENDTLLDMTYYPPISDQMCSKSYFRFPYLAYSCLKEERRRPNAENIVNTLEEILESQLQYDKFLDETSL